MCIIIMCIIIIIKFIIIIKQKIVKNPLVVLLDYEIIVTDKAMIKNLYICTYIYIICICIKFV